ncbi:MAG: glycosyltransferase [Balneolales bacterium]
MKTEKKPTVTIGISTYNRANQYLKDALDSAVAQLWPNLEIIVSDNCSEDHTEELVSRYSDSRIKYIRQKKNIGAKNNFNFCLNQAKGKYFLLLHDDDLIDQDFIKTCMQEIINHGDKGIICTGTRLIDKEGIILVEKPNLSGPTNSDFLLSWFSGKTALYLCSTLYNTKELREVGGFTSETNLFNDVAPILKLAEKYGRLDVKEVKASFRRHDENRGSSVKVEEWVRDSLHIINIIKNMNLENKDVIVRRAQYFLCRKCYRYVHAIPSLSQRLAAYKMVYQTFNYTYSPLRYFYRANIKPRLSLLKQKVSGPNYMPIKVGR